MRDEVRRQEVSAEWRVDETINAGTLDLDLGQTWKWSHEVTVDDGPAPLVLHFDNENRLVAVEFLDLRLAPKGWPTGG